MPDAIETSHMMYGLGPVQCACDSIRYGEFPSMIHVNSQRTEEIVSLWTRMLLGSEITIYLPYLWQYKDRKIGMRYARHNIN